MQLPDLTLNAAGSRHDFKLSAFGVPTVLVFHGQNTAEAALEVNKTVRAAHPDPSQVAIASIIDLRSFPSMFHGMVKPELEKAYLKASSKLPEGTDARDYVILLPDWDGSVTDTLGISNSTSTAAIMVADAAGNVVGTEQGENLGDAALKLLTGLLTDS